MEYNRSQIIKVDSLPQPSPGNAVRLLVNGNEALPVLLQLVEQSRHSIRMQVMLFEPDEIGFEIAGGLSQAARRGVRVQLSFNIDQTVSGTIADGFSREKKKRQKETMAAMLALLRGSGVDVLPNPSGVQSPGLWAGERARSILREMRAHIYIPANHYDHRKLLVLDDRQVLLGGMNIGHSYLYHHPPDMAQDMLAEARQRRQFDLPESWEKWLDTAFLIEGPAAALAALDFDWKWEVLGGQSCLPRDPVEYADGVPVQLLIQRPGLAESAARFFELVDSARREIYIASPFVSFEPALRALQSACRRGVRVVFVYPHARQEIPLSRRIFLKMAGHLLESGVELYFNDLRMAHTKLLVVDGHWVMFGSLNMNYRSFLHDLEITAVVEDDALAQEVIERVFIPYIQISQRVDRLPRVRWHPFDRMIKYFS